MELNTKESGMRSLIKETAKDIKFGLMDLYMKVTGRMIKPMGEDV
jgi:hypothetical protein